MTLHLLAFSNHARTQSQLGTRKDKILINSRHSSIMRFRIVAARFEVILGFILVVEVFKLKKEYVVDMHSTLFTSILLLASSLDLVIGTPLPRTNTRALQGKPNNLTHKPQPKPSKSKPQVTPPSRSSGSNPTKKNATKHKASNAGTKGNENEPKNQIATEINNETKNKATKVGQIVNQAANLIPQAFGSSEDHLISKLHSELNQGQSEQEKYNPTYQDYDAQSEQEADESDTTPSYEGSKTESPHENTEETSDSIQKDGTYEEYEPNNQGSDDQSEQEAAEANTTPTD
ncbi:hypothetical protein DSO57_1003354 [Entomophthora muscae]|uniref:Uncharacterized protein n=1 Tax=Entomophthora muscae TaxID=34485 RepID=A0ACC2U6D2_9FUNG|nr:hypothetical protein DSO57_1003354 [Entomophthora muscae]